MLCHHLAPLSTFEKVLHKIRICFKVLLFNLMQSNTTVLSTFMMPIMFHVLTPSKVLGFIIFQIFERVHVSYGVAYVVATETTSVNHT